MTANSPHIPIYTRRDLANLVAKHDHEHPDHGDDCGCQNGLIPTLRIYFAPPIPIERDVRPYVPPDVLPPKAIDTSERKPWLKRRAGETNAEYDYRTSHSCFNCGLFLVDDAALNEHEDRCSLQGRRGPDR